MKVLLTGAAGLLGSALLPRLAKAHEVIAVLHQAPLAEIPEQVRTMQVDLTQPAAVASLLNAHPVDLVLNCAAAVDVDRCEIDHDYALNGNRDLVANLLAARQRQAFRLIHISTDYVFDGVSGPPDESITPNPINFYGRSKLAGEELIRDAGGDSCIVRVCALYSIDPKAKPNLYSKILAALRSGESFPAATDLFTNPTEVNELAYALTSLVSCEQLPPLLHLAAPEYMSRYEFALQVAGLNGLDKSLVRKINSEELALDAARPKLAGLSSRFAAKELGLKLKSLAGLLGG
ncbi:MAG: SDR family oxidoreductase [bacterium]